MDPNEPQREDNPDKLWDMIYKLEEELRKATVYGSHWYSGESGIGDSHRHVCECGYSRYDFKKVQSHIDWKLAELKARVKG